ncbi:hypothetical protein F2P81_007356 [Scophthalmus maximus]|uniref:Uncharacterized protein n=1 Tax=Scophthalmus maximus TaxID=52904 RepID=A0A6A4TAL3_SCOMX|nr:hypothetical protein F2P81_007356 [Scophthalmus maximus]
MILHARRTSRLLLTRNDPDIDIRRPGKEISDVTVVLSERPGAVVLPVRTDTSVFVSIFDLRRKRFLCMDFKGELYMSRQRDKGECLFQRVWVDVANHHDVFYSASGGELLKLEGAERHRERPGRPPAAPRERVLGPSARRQRRSDEVNPSDPLRTHSHPSGAAKDQKDAASPGQPEQDQAGAVSKETITSCDDPLRVLQPNGPVSPVKTNIADRAEQD